MYYDVIMQTIKKNFEQKIYCCYHNNFEKLYGKIL